MQHGCGGGKRGCDLNSAPLPHALLGRIGKDKFPDKLPGKLCHVVAHQHREVGPYIKELVLRGLDFKAPWDARAMSHKYVNGSYVELRHDGSCNIFFPLADSNPGSTCFSEILGTLSEISVNIRQTMGDLTVLQKAVSNRVHEKHPENFQTLASAYLKAVPGSDIKELSRVLGMVVSIHDGLVCQLTDLGADPCDVHPIDRGDGDIGESTCLQIKLDDTGHGDEYARGRGWSDGILPGLVRDHGGTIDLLTAKCADQDHDHFPSLVHSRPKGWWPYFPRVVSQCTLATIKVWAEQGAEPFKEFELQSNPSSSRFRAKFEGTYTYCLGRGCMDFET